MKRYKVYNEEKHEMGTCPDCGQEFPIETMYCLKCQKKVKLDDKEKKEGVFLKEEKIDIKKIIKDLQGDFDGSNEEQYKGISLLKGLAGSDEDLANEFMKELNKATTEISKKLLDKYEKKEDFINKFLKKNLYK